MLSILARFHESFESLSLSLSLADALLLLQLSLHDSRLAIVCPHICIDGVGLVLRVDRLIGEV